MGYTLRLSLLAVLFFVGCGSPKVERIQEEASMQESSNTQEGKREEKQEEVQMPKLKLEDIPTTPQEQVIELQ